MNIRAGDVLHMTSFHHTQEGLKVSFKAPKGHTAAFMLLGDVRKEDQTTFEPRDVVKALGWADLEELSENLNVKAELAAFKEEFPAAEFVWFSDSDDTFYPIDEAHPHQRVAVQAYDAQWKVWLASACARARVWGKP